jgi:hypothetical protein
MLVCGPEEAVRKRALFYAVLLQGGMDPMTAAKKIKSEFVKIAGGNEIAESIKHISIDDFVRTLPTGQSRISFTARGQHQQQEEEQQSPPLQISAKDNEESN